ELADELISLGCAVAGFKLGHRGVYLKCADEDRMFRLRPGGLKLPDWDSAELYHPAYEVKVAGTTGAGDAAYAGLIAAMLRGGSLDEAASWFCAVGAYCCEANDATSGIRSLTETRERIDAGWPLRAVRL